MHFLNLLGSYIVLECIAAKILVKEKSKKQLFVRLKRIFPNARIFLCKKGGNSQGAYIRFTAAVYPLEGKRDPWKQNYWTFPPKNGAESP